MLTRGRLVPRQPRAIKRTTPTALHDAGIYIAIFIHWNTGTTPTALHDASIYIAIVIHWNTDTTPVALPIGNTLNISCLHLKNMNIFVDVWAFLSQFFISTHVHFMPLTCKQCLAK